MRFQGGTIRLPALESSEYGCKMDMLIDISALFDYTTPCARDGLLPKTTDKTDVFI